MLDELVVQNLGIIEWAQLEPGPGLVTFTGETGTGKTMLLGAIRLLAGLPARTELIGPFADEAKVEGRLWFPDGTERVIVRRVAAGRSRAYVDGGMVPLAVLEELADGVFELVAQHEKLRLTRAAEARVLLDRCLGSEGSSVRDAYDHAWERLSDLRRDQERLGGDRRALERELDLASHEAKEIAAAGFRPGEDVELTDRAVRLRHAEELAVRLGTVRERIEGAGEELGTALAELNKAAGLDRTLRGLTEQAAGLVEILNDLRTDVRRAAEEIEHDPAALEETEQRLALLGSLRRKYGDTLEAVLDYGSKAVSRRDRLKELLAGADRLAAELETAAGRVEDLGTRLRAAREEAAETVAGGAVRHLVDLGFDAPVVRFAIEPSKPGLTGCDSVQLLFASDTRLEAGPLSRVASGGELSRLVLALRLAGGADRTPVIAFDEIDAGVGGRTALALGRKLAQLAAGRQVLCVTHLPQVAAFADRHFVVERSGNRVSVDAVSGERRLAELTRMLSGLPDSEQGRNHAEELVAIAAGSRRPSA